MCMNLKAVLKKVFYQCWFNILVDWFLGEMREHHHLDEGMRWRIVGRLEAGQSHAQVARELNITPSVISNL